MSGQVIQFSAGDITKFHTILINDDIECEKDPNENLFSNIAVRSGIPDISITVPRAHVTIDDTAEHECGKLNSPYNFAIIHTSTKRVALIIATTMFYCTHLQMCIQLKGLWEMYQYQGHLSCSPGDC